MRWRLVLWPLIAVISVGVMVLLYARDEVPMSAPLMMLGAFGLGSIDLLAPRLELLADFFGRSLFFGTAIYASDVVFENETFDTLSALIVGGVYGLLMGLWDYLSDPDPQPENA